MLDTTLVLVAFSVVGIVYLTDVKQCLALHDLELG